jgi:hypothetical protein
MCLLCNGSAVLLPDLVSNPANTNIILGSAEFLEALSNASMMWRHAELFEVSPARLDEASTSCKKAIQLLTSAGNRYREILQLVNRHGAKPEALDALRRFDYDSLAKAFNFAGDQWESFVATAKAGNVYGLLNDFVEGVGRLIEGLEYEKAFFDDRRMPPASSFGRLMSQWQEVIRHGYQSAQVFQNLGLPPVGLSRT